MGKTALVLGVGGQDGSLLAELLLARGYLVHGMHPFFDTLRNVEHLKDRVTLHPGDLLDPTSLYRLVEKVGPDEIYNEADLDSIGWSREVPAQSLATTAAPVVTLLEAVRLLDRDIRVFQPLSVTVFGNAPPPQHEATPLDPRSPYACAKAAAWHLCRYYRNEVGLFVSCGVLGNHDSPRRGGGYLLQKICGAAVRISRGQQDHLTLGGLGQRVDIGHARDYAEAAWLSLQAGSPGDYLIATGVAWTIGEMVAEAFRSACVKGDWSERVLVDPSLAGKDPPEYRGDITRARRELGWYPRVGIAGLIEELVTEAFLRGA